MLANFFISAAACATFTGLALSTASAHVTIPTVPIGNPGNPGDSTNGFGTVFSTYAIGRTEVTNGQYTAFLNAKAASDPLGLYNPEMAGSFGGIARTGSDGSYFYSTVPGRENNPVNWVSFWDATRFANWLHNGQGTGDTETGAYTLTPNGIDDNTVTRNAGWRWAVPTEDEWYKAAYHQPANDGGDVDDYWLYPTSSNNPPQGMEANFGGALGGTTPVGSFAANYYGTFDMGGNVWEWNEQPVFPHLRGLRGGAFDSLASYLGAGSRESGFPSTEYFEIGFRVIQIPTPASVPLLVCAGLAAARRHR